MQPANPWMQCGCLLGAARALAGVLPVQLARDAALELESPGSSDESRNGCLALVFSKPEGVVAMAGAVK